MTVTNAKRRASIMAATADDKLNAARCAARWTMLARHGCTGKRCKSPQHAADRELRQMALWALGLIPDPEAQWLPGWGYRGSGKRRDEGAA